ncbi:MAG: hypothetical protein LBU27_01575 [Candidatus Peribacteria bacterium]|nr:hypothetical protein [Candidatus Peribacteria bacterium]
MLIFSSFENVFLFAQEISISLEEPFFQEELPQIQSGDEVSGEEIGENDIYIDNQHFQEADDELFEQGIVSS